MDSSQFSSRSCFVMPLNSFDLLPNEVLENIIIFCDGKSLLNLAKTCKRWKMCIEQPKKFLTKKWNLVCMNEINEDFLIDILQNLYPRYWVTKELCWKSVYTSWRQWSHLEKWLPCVEVFCRKTKNCASCIKFSGKWLFITTSYEGGLEAVNYVSKKKVLLYQCNSVEDIYLRSYTYDTDSRYRILEDLEHDEVILVLSRHYIRYDLRNRHATTHPKTCRSLTLKYFEDREVSVTKSTAPSKLVSENVITQRQTSLQKENLVISNVMQVWNGKVVLLDFNEVTREGSFQVTDYEFKKVDHPLTKYKLDSVDYLLFLKKQRYHLGVFIFIDHAKLEIIVDGKLKNYMMYANFACQITSTLYYAGLLFLGSEMGVIYIYRMNNDEELLSLNLSQYDCYIDVCSEPILALDVKETLAKPIIAAASEYSVYIVTFE